MAATSLRNDVFSLKKNSKTITSERLVARVLTMIRWWEASGSGEMAPEASD